MLIKFSIRVVTGTSVTGCFAIDSTEVTIDGNKDLINTIIAKIKEIPGVRIE